MFTPRGSIDHLAMLPRRRELPHRAAGRALIVRDPAARKVHYLNAAAAIIWRCCDGHTSLFECQRRLQASLAVPHTVDLAADTLSGVAELARRDLLDEVPAL